MLSAKLNDINRAELSKLIKVKLNVCLESGNLLQSSAFITQCLGSMGMDCVISELC